MWFSTISLPERPSPRRTRSPSSPRRHVDGRTRGIRVQKPRLGWCRRGRSGLSIADASLRVHISPSAKTASFSSKDRFGRCCKAVVVRLRAPGFAGVFASFPKVILQRVTTGAPPSCLLHLHASRRMHGMYGLKHGSVDIHCCLFCTPLVLIFAVCHQVDHIVLRDQF